MLSVYANKFITQGTIQVLSPPPVFQENDFSKSLTSTEQSQLDINVDTNADLIVTDSNGNKTGFDPRTNQVFNSVLGAEYFLNGTINNDTGVADPNFSHFLYVYGSANQNLKVSVIGNNAGPYHFSVIPYDPSGALQDAISLDGVASPGSVDQFTVQSGVISPVPSAPKGFIEIEQKQSQFVVGEKAWAIIHTKIQPTNPEFEVTLKATLDGVPVDLAIFSKDLAMFESAALSNGVHVLRVRAYISTQEVDEASAYFTIAQTSAARSK